MTHLGVGILLANLPVASASTPEAALQALVDLGELAIPALGELGCAHEDAARRAQVVLALQQLGTSAAGEALVQIADCSAGEMPEVHGWAVEAAVAVAPEPQVLVALYERHHDYPEVLAPVRDQAVVLADAGQFRLRHWLAVSSGPSSLPEALAESHPHLVPVDRLAQAVAQDPDPEVQARAAGVLLRVPTGHPGLGEALVEAHRFDALAGPPPWSSGPQVGRFTLPPVHAQALASELIAWLLAAESAAKPTPPVGLAEAAWSFVAPRTKRLGQPRDGADWLHLWAAFEAPQVVADQLPLPMLPASLEAAWDHEVAFQQAVAYRDRRAIAVAATAPSQILRSRAHMALQTFRRGAQRRALGSAYHALSARLDAESGPRAYGAVASIVAEGQGIVRWRDVAPLGRQLIGRYLRADRLDEWTELYVYEDALLELQDAYDDGRGTGGCCTDAWLTWLARVDGRAEVRARLRQQGLMRVPHYRTLVRTRLR